MGNETKKVLSIFGFHALVIVWAEKSPIHLQTGKEVKNYV